MTGYSASCCSQRRRAARARHNVVALRGNRVAARVAPGCVLLLRLFTPLQLGASVWAGAHESPKRYFYVGIVQNAALAYGVHMLVCAKCASRPH